MDSGGSIGTGWLHRIGERESRMKKGMLGETSKIKDHLRSSTVLWKHNSVEDFPNIYLDEDDINETTKQVTAPTGYVTK